MNPPGLNSYNTYINNNDYMITISYKENVFMRGV